MSPRRPVRRQSYLVVYAVIAAFMLLSHGPLLDVPFYWDELGQFIPASLDLLRSGALVPHSTIPNVHPPGLMAVLALVWKIFGYSIAGTRVSMLLIAALGVLFTFLLAIELGRGAPGAPALIAPALLSISPLFFAQSMLAELDMPAMCLTALALLLFLQNRMRASALACVALVLVKETGLAAALVCAVWLLSERRIREASWYLLPAAALALWLALLRRETGHWFGNHEFTQYNIFYPLHPVRFGLALARRLYYLLLSTGHFLGTGAVVWAMRRMPIFRDRAWRVVSTFATVHVLMVSALGGAVLERYLLPVLPILYTAFAISLRALLPKTRQWTLAGLFACLIAASFINPVYPFPYENNLAFLSFVSLGQEAAQAAEVLPGTIATTFPMSGALRRPEYGYVSAPRHVAEMKSFHRSEVARFEARRPEVMIVYDTAWDPLHILQSGLCKRLMARYYDYETPLTAEQISQLLSMKIARTWERHGLRMTLLVRDPGAVQRLGVAARKIDFAIIPWTPFLPSTS